ncbi:MAG: hypothetical protein JNK85_28830 [Verrucomicrobiales bacterium]|nr:hypothetical protein [Verrucomicrobiales bacterium]
MFGLTSLGVVHTLISLVALGAGLIALIRDREILARSTLGRVYIWTTILVCLTGFPIMQHGGFGKPHALGVLTLIVLVIAALAGRSKFGGASRYVEVVSYSATFFFHWIPTVVETTTRLPLGAPLIKDRDGPELQAATGVLFLLFLIGATAQVLRLRLQLRQQPQSAQSAAISAQQANRQPV